MLRFARNDPGSRKQKAKTCFLWRNVGVAANMFQQRFSCHGRLPRKNVMMVKLLLMFGADPTMPLAFWIGEQEPVASRPWRPRLCINSTGIDGHNLITKILSKELKERWEWKKLASHLQVTTCLLWVFSPFSHIRKDHWGRTAYHYGRNDEDILQVFERYLGSWQWLKKPLMD